MVGVINNCPKIKINNYNITNACYLDFSNGRRRCKMYNCYYLFFQNPGNIVLFDDIFLFSNKQSDISNK